MDYNTSIIFTPSKMTIKATPQADLDHEVFLAGFIVATADEVCVHYVVIDALHTRKPVFVIDETGLESLDEPLDVVIFIDHEEEISRNIGDRVFEDFVRDAVRGGPYEGCYDLYLFLADFERL